MTTPQTAPYGSWKSPITSDLIVAGSVRLGEVYLDGDTIYWGEGRPTEGGRTLLVRQDPDGQRTDLTPAPFNVRTRVHEYGGGSYCVVDGVIYFANFADQRVYRQEGEDLQPITPDGGYRYADATADRSHQRLIAVREDHTREGNEPSNTIAAISTHPDDPAQNGGTVLVSGSDFYAYPRLSPDESHLCWISWNHPNMPWDGTELWVADVQDDGSLGTPSLVAGGESESIFQPSWSPDGTLYFVSDRTGWWNLYRWENSAQIQPLCPKTAEFGLPLWVFGMATYGFESAESLICSYSENGVDHLAQLNLKTLELQDIETPYTSIGGVRVGNGFVVFGGGTPTLPGAIAHLDLATGTCKELRRSSDLDIPEAYISVAETIEFPTEEGKTAFGFFYPPKNPDFVAPDGELPPLLVKSHGGPTAATSATFNAKIQYWTSRGIAVLDVNYGGSTGYGREYRNRLQGKWGIVDVDDCANGAKFLAEQGRVDGDRLCIDGGSAGGYTTLAALAFRDVFKAGASFYGVSDLEALAKETHKFESRYLDGLVGAYPETEAIYKARSPIHAIDQLNCPMIFFQGDEDAIVPPNQAEMMVAALKAKGLPVAYLLFEGEQHGFRKSENIKRTLDGELYFYAQVFGFQVADAIEPVAIANL
ncbi:MAG: prolyl oligopeptidase family serine peptidase [Cyanobacteria bacterium J06638_22]